MSEYILRAKDVYKSFSGVKALQGVSLDIKAGEIHSMAGENGCGKSTLIKIISGVYEKDSGTIEIDGEAQEQLSPISSINKGIQVIYQDFSVFPNLTVMENLALTNEVTDKRKLVNWKRFRRIAEEATQKINFNIDLHTIVGDLAVADKQRVAIARALLNNAKLIIMDEPTTALTKNEVRDLFKTIKELQQTGIAMLFVSHKLDEVFEIADRFTILRNGKNVMTGDSADLDNASFSYYMTGRHFDNKEEKTHDISNEIILETRNLSMNACFENINFKLHKGEIIGITGLLGSGRTELALALFGLKKYDHGEIYIKSKPVNIARVEDAIKHRIAYVPEDRLTEGLFLNQSISRNIFISELKNLATAIGSVDQNKVGTIVKQWIETLNIKVSDSENPVSTLSGGNQQRVVLAKCLATKPEILILNGPTVGVDIGSKHDLHKALHDLAAQGLSIIIISDDLPEMLENCSRIYVMREGKFTAEKIAAQTEQSTLVKLISDIQA